jgi:cytochrome c oxidase accessory protein FixG
MLDKNSMVVAYDFVRGEPRGNLKKDAPNDKGDCIDCKLCVNVCPTGIDIRNGTQLECINCTACIDACDEVMLKIEKPKGLIRFASFNNIMEGKKLGLNLRNGSYTLVLLGLFSVFLYMLITRKQIETTLLRTPGMLFQKQADGRISNLYSIEFVNKTFNELPIEIKLIEPKGEIKLIDGELILVQKECIGKTSFFLIREAKSITKITTPIVIEIISNGKFIETMHSSFNGPVLAVEK